MLKFTEMLKGKQHKIDKNKNGKVDAHDFKLLRKEEEMCEQCDMPKSECECEHEMKEAKHVIGVTVSDPNHTMVSQRNEKKMRKAKVSAVDKDTAINTALAYYRKRGMKVHDHNYIGLHNEETKTNDVPFDGPYTSTFKKKNNPNRSPMDAARALAQQGMKKKMKEEFDIDITDEQADSLLEMHAPVAPVPDKKYIKGTPENKALKAARKPINGMPTNKMKEEVELEEATVDTKKYSWGTMKTIHQGSSFNIPLHPEHHQAIAKLKDQQEHKFKTEDGKHWTAKRSGDDVHFQGANGGSSTKVKHSTMKEEVEELDELSKSTLSSYAKKGALDSIMRFGKASTTSGNKKPDHAEADKAGRRYGGVVKAIDRLSKEEVESIDELSKDTLNSYRDQAVDHKEKLKNNIARKTDHVQQMNAMGRDASDDKAELSTSQKLLKNRRSGIDKAGERLAKEEVEQIEEAKPGLYANINAKRKRIEAGSGERMRKPGSKGAPSSSDFKDAAKTAKEEVEIKEVNNREFASQGKMHPDMAKHMKTGEHMDYYEPKTGDKVHGKVMKNDGKEVHVKQTHDSYDPKKVGSVHKFVVSNKLDESKLNSQKEENQLKKFKQFKEEIYDKLSSNEESIEEQVDDLDEMEFDKSGKYVHKGKYGTSYQGDDEEDDDKPKKPAPAGEKRGRGRPAGSMSGAKQKGSGPAKKRSGVEYTGFKLHLPNNNR